MFTFTHSLLLAVCAGRVDSDSMAAVLLPDREIGTQYNGHHNKQITPPPLYLDTRTYIPPSQMQEEVVCHEGGSAAVGPRNAKTNCFFVSTWLTGMVLVSSVHRRGGDETLQQFVCWRRSGQRRRWSMFAAAAVPLLSMQMWDKLQHVPSA